MAYQFQSWDVNSVATAEDVSQIEVNIRDHIHGVDGVAKTALRTPNPDTDFYVKDDFVGGKGGSGTAPDGIVGELGWRAPSSSGSIGVSVIEEADHPGVNDISLPGTINTSHWIELDRFRLNTGAMFDFMWKFSPTSNVNVTYRLGFFALSAADPPTNGIYIEKKSGDTNWFGTARSSDTESRVNMGVAVTANAWYSVRVRRIDASTIGFTVNNGSELTVTSNIPVIQAGMMAYIKLNEAVAKTLRVDYFDLAISGLSR